MFDDALIYIFCEFVIVVFRLCYLALIGSKLVLNGPLIKYLNFRS